MGGGGSEGNLIVLRSYTFSPSCGRGISVSRSAAGLPPEHDRVPFTTPITSLPPADVYISLQTHSDDGAASDCSRATVRLSRSRKHGAVPPGKQGCVLTRNACLHFHQEVAPS